MYQGKFAKNNPQRGKSAAPDAAQSTDAPELTEAVSQRPVRRKRPQRPVKKNKNGTILFYSIYAACILVFFIAMICVMDPLRDWLIKYEASQPGYKRDQVYAELFADPDWKNIYKLAGIENSTFENADTFAAHMEEKVGNKELTCLETSAGLSGDKKYIIKLDDEKIASFTLTGGSENETEIPQWELGSVEVFFSGNTSVIVEKLPGQTVYINGVALDDSYTIRKIFTKAEHYLPEGVHGLRLEQQQVTGLLTSPNVVVKDASGAEVAVTLDPNTGIYTQSIAQNAASTEEKELALNATQTYAKYMIGKATLGEVQKHFDTKSQFYETIRRSEVGWVQSGKSYDFSEAVYSDYYRYSDDLFSIKIDVTLNQTRFDNSVKEYELNNTMFFKKNAGGKWQVMEATNIDVQQRQEEVLLTFMHENEVLSSEFVDCHASSVKLPAVTAPEGMVFTGWAQETKDESGNTTLTVVFEPVEGNEVFLPSGNTLQPMTLKALFEEA